MRKQRPGNQDEQEYEAMSDENKAFLKTTRNMYDIQERDPRFDKEGQITVDLPGLPHFIIKKMVYSPEHVSVSMAWPEWIAERAEGKSFLDMGTGTGIAAIYVAMHGNPENVVAADISPAAVANCEENAEQYELEEPSFRTYESDVFDAIPEGDKFDTMYWNFPWNAPDQEIEEILEEAGEEADPEKVMQLRAGLDTYYRALKKFIKEGKDRLNEGGEIYLFAGQPARHDIIYGEAEKHGYNIEIAAEQEMDVDIVNITKLRLILYKLTRHEI